MGKWDHRPTRRFFRQKRSPNPPPRFYDINAPLPEFWQDGIPLWEKKYCTLIGSVPWQKILDSKKLLYCHSNVQDWSDSGAEEAFQDAKKRYWAKIKNLPCDISPPDPDAYVDQIDWNPYIDPELIKEVERAYFSLPDEEQGNDATKNKRAKLSVNVENPWECTDSPLSNALENKVQGWSQRDDHVDESGDMDNTDNPWECSVTRENGGLTDNAWKGGGVKSWGWNEGKDYNNHSRDWDSGHSPSENDRLHILSQKDKGWGKVRDGSWNQHQSNNLANISNPWKCKSSQQNGTPTCKGWGNYGANMSGWKQQGNADISSDLQFRRNYGGWTGSSQSFLKREGSNRHTLGYNGYQFRRDEYQIDHNWRREKNKRRGSFNP